MEYFEYESIESPHDLRACELLPGNVDEDVHIKLYHQPLSTLKECEALSYEWGGQIKDNIIYCDGKILKVTRNLMVALKRLRNKKLPSSESRLLWIDAVCINQRDADEVPKQILIMSKIYSHAKRVLVWIGEEKTLTREAFGILPVLAMYFEKSVEPLGELDENNDWRIIRQSSMLVDGDRIEQLTQEECWPSVLELLTSRTYFTRLWTVQEVALSQERETLVICGNVFTTWAVFHRAAGMILHCAFLRKSAKDQAILGNIFNQRNIQKNFHDNTLTIWDCVHLTCIREFFDLRDRYFGLLGLFNNEIRSQLAHIDYNRSAPEEIYQASAMLLIRRERHLYHFRLLNSTPAVNKLSKLSTWALRFDHIAPWLLPTFPSILELLIGEDPVVEGMVLYAEGLILDTVVHVSDNFSEQNLRAQVLEAYDQLEVSLGELYDDDSKAIDPLWQALIAFQQGFDDYSGCRHRFVTILNRWLLDSLGITSETLAQNPTVRDLAKNYPRLASTYPETLESVLDLRAFCIQSKELSQALRKAAATSDNEKFIGISMESRLFYNANGKLANQGRNLFTSAKHYLGIGPMGDNRDGDITTAVQVGDQIAVIARTTGPVILRPLDDGSYILVGCGYVTYLLDAPCLQPDKVPRLSRLRIC
jgi:Heterokaryon incompatibility protein (HET)